MILTPAILNQIIDTINEGPTVPVILPDHAYGPDGRVVVYVERVPIDLHRHLFNVMVRPLGYHEEMHLPPEVDPRNVNPYLYLVVGSRRELRTHCNKGHAYKGNEAPPNSRGYRCLTCLRASIHTQGAVANRDKTHCPKLHPYSPENTRVMKDGRRRCITCTRDKNNKYMRRKRAEQREKS